MNKKILFSSILCGLFFSPFVSANDKVEKVYDSQRYQQVCKGKSQGTAVSFAYRGIIWNGTCEPQFFPSSKNANIHGDEAELASICQGDSKATSINIEGKEIKGKKTVNNSESMEYLFYSFLSFVFLSVYRIQ